MPSLCQEDHLVVSTLVEWKIIAAGQIEDIGAWRDNCAQKIFRQSPFDNGEPNAFWTFTAAIVGWVARKFPSLNPSPVQEIYAAINAWHTDRNADRIPPQNELEGILAQAMIVASAIHDEIYSRNPTHHRATACVSGKPVRPHLPLPGTATPANCPLGATSSSASRTWDRPSTSSACWSSFKRQAGPCVSTIRCRIPQVLTREQDGRIAQ